MQAMQVYNQRSDEEKDYNLYPLYPPWPLCSLDPFFSHDPNNLLGSFSCSTQNFATSKSLDPSWSPPAVMILLRSDICLLSDTHPLAKLQYFCQILAPGLTKRWAGNLTRPPSLPCSGERGETGSSSSSFDWTIWVGSLDDRKSSRLVASTVG